MEPISLLTSSSSSSSSSLLDHHFSFTLPHQSSSARRFPLPTCLPKQLSHATAPWAKPTLRQASLRTTVDKVVPKDDDSPSSPSRDSLPKVDKSGRFCSPRAARELALSIIYAACLEGTDPVRLFEKRVNAGREPVCEFDKAWLMEYNHMSFGGPPITVQTAQEADEIVRKDEKESAIEAGVLAAPPKLVYSKLILRFTRKLLVAVVDGWESHVLVIDKVAPQNWKNEPAGRILELCILHLAMSEIAVVGTRYQIVINEAVDLAKRFCDGAAPRIINGCLRSFVKDISETHSIHRGESGTATV